MKKLLAICSVSLTLAGCGFWNTVDPGTRVPAPITARIAAPDDTTPKGLNHFNNGFIGYEVCGDGVIRAVVTPAKRTQYAEMVARYGDRYFKEQGVHVDASTGVRVFDGKMVPGEDLKAVADTVLYSMDDSTVLVFATMRQWARNEQGK